MQYSYAGYAEHNEMLLSVSHADRDADLVAMQKYIPHEHVLKKASCANSKTLKTEHFRLFIDTLGLLKVSFLAIKFLGSLRRVFPSNFLPLSYCACIV